MFTHRDAARVTQLDADTPRPAHTHKTPTAHFIKTTLREVKLVNQRKKRETITLTSGEVRRTRGYVSCSEREEESGRVEREEGGCEGGEGREKKKKKKPTHLTHTAGQKKEKEQESWTTAKSKWEREREGRGRWRKQDGEREREKHRVCSKIGKIKKKTFKTKQKKKKGVWNREGPNIQRGKELVRLPWVNGWISERSEALISLLFLLRAFICCYIFPLCNAHVVELCVTDETRAGGGGSVSAPEWVQDAGVKEFGRLEAPDGLF